MKNNIERDLGTQPILKIMDDFQLTHHNIVAASTEQITHKMVKKACKGRRLSSKLQRKLCNAINNATKKEYSIPELFTY